MTEQQRLFASEFVKRRCRYGTGKEAAIAAGYSERTASAIASNLLRREDVQEYISELKAHIEADLREDFLFDAVEARKALYEILSAPGAEDRDKIAAARDLLDRAGFKPTEKQVVKVSTPTIIDNITGDDDGG